MTHSMHAGSTCQPHVGLLLLEHTKCLMMLTAGTSESSNQADVCVIMQQYEETHLPLLVQENDLLVESGTLLHLAVDRVYTTSEQHYTRSTAYLSRLSSLTWPVCPAVRQLSMLRISQWGTDTGPALQTLWKTLPPSTPARLTRTVKGPACVTVKWATYQGPSWWVTATAAQKLVLA